MHDKEEKNQDLLDARNLFMERLHDALGPVCVTGDFEKEDLTPEFQYYADEDETGFEGTPDEPLPPTPEAGDNYVGARVNLPRGDGEALRKVVERARDSDSNPVGRANQTSILDIRQYIVEFEDGQQTELAANTIAQSMYAQCDADGNNYLLFDSIVDHRRGTSALTYEDQIIRRKSGRTYIRRSTRG